MNIIYSEYNFSTSDTFANAMGMRMRRKQEFDCIGTLFYFFSTSNLLVNFWAPFYISSILLIFLLSCSLLAFPSCWWQMCSDTILFSLLYKRQRPHSYTERSEASHVQTTKVCKLKSTFRNHQPSQPWFGTIWKIPMFPRNSNLRHFSVRQSVLLKIIELGAWVRLVRGEVSKREFVISEQR